MTKSRMKGRDGTKAARKYDALHLPVSAGKIKENAPGWV
ncbi:hypothetical protein J2Z75_000474 [Rhizobium herbae]|uniref:Integrase n=1 Tax=Rhizobium herbae TaxID=508661 RepID=A0ABS4EGC0_9HYPH|nr:hypothetical protein [Rhizobium herbae]